MTIVLTLDPTVEPLLMLTIIIIMVCIIPVAGEGSCQAPGCPDSSMQPPTNRFSSAERGLLLLLGELSCVQALMIWFGIYELNCAMGEACLTVFAKGEGSKCKLALSVFQLVLPVFLSCMSTIKAATHIWTFDYPQSPPMHSVFFVNCAQECEGS